MCQQSQEADSSEAFLTPKSQKTVLTKSVDDRDQVSGDVRRSNFVANAGGVGAVLALVDVVLRDGPQLTKGGVGGIAANGFVRIIPDELLTLITMACEWNGIQGCPIPISIVSTRRESLPGDPLSYLVSNATRS